MVTHIPIGYKIEGGIIVRDENTSVKVQNFFKSYLSGESLSKAAKISGINVLHSGAKSILKNKKYLGDSQYPQIIDEDTFQKVQEEIYMRAVKLGRIYQRRGKTEKPIPTKFFLEPLDCDIDNPIVKIKFLYDMLKEVS